MNFNSSFKAESRLKALWLTGLSGAGKSSLARTLSQVLAQNHMPAIVLDGDELRAGLSANLGFSTEDRRENIRRTAHVARLFLQAEVLPIVALISPCASDRELARAIIGDNQFCEIHVATPLATCEQRDPKGLYRRARAGMLPGFTGIDALYEAPAHPDFIIDASQQSTTDASQMIIQGLRLAVTGRNTSSSTPLETTLSTS